MFKGWPGLIIAEMAQAHEGSLDIARLIVHSAARAGADAIKFQVFTADELAVPSFSAYSLYRNIEFRPDEWSQLLALAHDLKLQAFADIFGAASAKMLVEIGIDALKIHSSDVKNFGLLEFVGGLGKPILLSAGGSTVEEIGEALEVLRGSGARDICLMHGFQNFPTQIADTELRRLRLLHERFHLPVGFADHVDGGNDFATILPLMALAAGASVIEKHLTLNRSLEGEDYFSSLNPPEFFLLVQRLRAAEACLGRASFEMSERELEYRKGHKKHIVAGRTLHEGERLTLDALAYKRVETDRPIFDVRDLVGRVVKRNIGENEKIMPEDLE